MMRKQMDYRNWRAYTWVWPTDSRSQSCTAPSSLSPEVRSEEVGAPLVGRVYPCPCFSSLPMGHTWSFLFCQKAIEEAMWATPNFEKAKILQDNRSCVIPRPLERGCAPHPCDRSPMRFFNVYVDSLGVLGTSRDNVYNDLMMAIQKLKSRGLDIHEEIVHSTRPSPLGIQIALRNMLVSVAPTCLWRLKQGLR